MKPQLGTVALNAQTLEDEKVASAIKTDFILSAEIMAITLAALPAGSLWMQSLVLALVGIGITAAVYGVVALIVKADDVGLALASNDGASAFAAVWAGHSDAASFAACPCFLTVAQRRRHRRHDLGRRRHRPAWPGDIRPAFDRPRRPRRYGGGGSRPPVGRRLAGMDRSCRHIRRHWPVDRRGLDPDRWICSCTGMETVEAFPAGPSWREVRLTRSETWRRIAQACPSSRPYSR